MATFTLTSGPDSFPDTVDNSGSDFIYGLAGVDTIDVTDTGTDIFALHHSGYAEKKALLEDIREIILTGKRPPEGRVPPLQRVLIDRGIYWRYPAQP